MAHSKSHFLFLAKRWKDLQDVHHHQELIIKWCSVFPLHVQFYVFHAPYYILSIFADLSLLTSTSQRLSRQSKAVHLVTILVATLLMTYQP